MTTDGRRVALDVDAFPWKPPSLAEALGESFTRNDAEKTAVAARDVFSEGGENKHVGVYFSAHWCGPCRQFTPKLAATYERLRAEGKDFEVLFVSSDRSEGEFETYASESMPPWLLVPFADADRRRALAEHFGVRGIPHFAMLDSAMNVVNPDARAALARDALAGAAFPWPPPLVVDVDSEEMDAGINDTPTLVVLMEEAGPRWDDLTEALHAVARKTRAKELEAGFERRRTLFATVTETGGGVGGQLRRLAKLGRASAAPQMVLLDLANGGYVTHEGEVDERAIERLVDEYVAGRLELTTAK